VRSSIRVVKIKADGVNVGLTAGRLRDLPAPRNSRSSARDAKGPRLNLKIRGWLQACDGAISVKPSSEGISK